GTPFEPSRRIALGPGLGARCRQRAASRSPAARAVHRGLPVNALTTALANVMSAPTIQKAAACSTISPFCLTISSFVKANDAVSLTIAAFVETNVAPCLTIAALVETNVAPCLTIAALVETNVAPCLTIAALVETNDAPCLTIAAFVETNDAPCLTIAAFGRSKAAVAWQPGAVT